MKRLRKHSKTPCKWALALFASFSICTLFTGCNSAKKDDTLTLRICNWEEYIDEGGWDEEETIDLEDKDIIGENSMIDDFTAWYKETTGKDIKVEYSCFGSNEELYNQLTLGDTFDLVCPSEYMIMKLLAEDELIPLSDGFWDTENPDNYYARGVASYIREKMGTIEINNESIDKYAAGYMWGTTGIVYNPEVVSAEEASTWKVLTNPKFRCQVTIKDNVRDSYFAAVGILKSEKLMEEQLNYYANSSHYPGESTLNEQITKEMNDTSPDTIAQVEELLQDNKDHFYSFESDSGKADMITGKVVANYQWSGDAVYTLDQAEEDDYELCYSVPTECSNLWFDGWVLMKDGIGKDAEKQAAAEAFINYVSMPDNVVRNMYYIGYTSAIAGGDDDTIFQYADWCYGADEEENAEELTKYDLSYFFQNENDLTADEDNLATNEDDSASDENNLATDANHLTAGENDSIADEDAASADEQSFETGNRYVITTTKDQEYRQLFAQYPTPQVLERCAVMDYFGNETNKELNQMWINVRCFNPFRK